MIASIAASRPKLLSRTEFLGRISTILGSGQRLLYVPNGTDTTTSVESSTAGRTITWDGSIASRVRSNGRGFEQDFNGSSQYGECPDAANLSFGNGTTDSAFTVLAWAKISDTAGVRGLLAKATTSNREWRLAILGDDTMVLSLWDESAGIGIGAISPTAVKQGVWGLFSATYDGRGGATAASGITLYQDGVSLGAPPSNNASYVAMEDKAATLEIGTRVAHTQDWFNGSIGMLALTQKELAAAEHAEVRRLCLRYFKPR